ncbi:MAG: hypothetical protein QOF69_3228, partial [Solirubrobacteraceae bacterium]|nr:hypothetical protein [Solirubrobacteraceae bacterium]
DRERTTGTRVPAGPGVPLWVWALIAGATLLAGALAVVCLRLRRRLNAR